MNIKTSSTVEMKDSEYRKLKDALSLIMDFVELYEKSDIGSSIPVLPDDLYGLTAYIDAMECIDISD